uniref:Uncharacterized protein n=1 Tax=Arundo donax TaxID=35708 RepID=A0A0A9HLG8_ARUDO
MQKALYIISLCSYLPSSKTKKDPCMQCAHISFSVLTFSSPSHCLQFTIKVCSSASLYVILPIKIYSEGKTNTRK